MLKVHVLLNVSTATQTLAGASRHVDIYHFIKTEVLSQLSHGHVGSRPLLAPLQHTLQKSFLSFMKDWTLESLVKGVVHKLNHK